MTGHEKVGHTGQGLWHHKGWQLPAYIQHVANDLIESGHGESRAIEMAVGIVKNWAAGHDGHGNHVHADTQAKAAAAVAEWEAMKAAASKGSKRRSTQMTTYTRSFPLEDISIRTGGDGRTVDAYAAVFNAGAPVRDPDGEYEEVIDPAAFNRVIEHRSRSKNGWGIPVLFNHGMTIFGTPSERYSVPIGVPEEIRADTRGLFTRTRYHKSVAADEVLEAIREGSISSYSFRGEFPRSDPKVPRGGFRRDHAGHLRSVRRMESTLMEYGPATFPVYEGADVVSVRAEQAALLLGNLAPGEFDRLADMLRPGTLHDPPDDGTPSDEGPAADDPREAHSARSPREELQRRRAQFLIRHGGENA
jgi:HK97 family phage prohead protease